MNNWISSNNTNKNRFLQSSNSSSIYYIHKSQLKYMMPWSMDDFDIHTVKSQPTINDLQEKKDQLNKQLKTVLLKIKQLEKV